MINLGSGLLVFSSLIFFILSFSRWRSRMSSHYFSLALLGMMLWALAPTIDADIHQYPNAFTWILDVFIFLVWMLYGFKAIAEIWQGYNCVAQLTHISSALLILFLISLFVLLPYFDFRQIRESSVFLNYAFITFALLNVTLVIASLSGLYLIRQLSNKTYNTLIGAFLLLFSFQSALYICFLFSPETALLFIQIKPYFFTACLILFAYAMETSQSQIQSLSFSRDASFYISIVLLLAVLLVSILVGEYYVHQINNNIGIMLHAVLVIVAVLATTLILFSNQVRSRIKVFVDKHFLDYKYDYRDEWLRLIRKMSVMDETSLESRVVSAFTDMLNAPDGCLWLRCDKHYYAPVAGKREQNMRESTESSMCNYLADSQWVINIDEYQKHPHLYGNLALPAWLLHGQSWLVVPLMLQNRLYGFVEIDKPLAARDFNWEDIDLLKTAGREVASHLAQARAASALIEARQFDAFNRLSAYVVHDLKNLVSQLDLLVSNADKHKHNPAFIDDTIKTVENAVTRMSKLLYQLNEHQLDGERNRQELNNLLKQVIADKSNQRPQPEWIEPNQHFYIDTDAIRFIAIIGHLVQNAQDAAKSTGQVSIELKQSGRFAIITIKDNGDGMDQDFIQNRLFKPFDTTKGLTGMGIGAHEAKVFIEAMGGSIHVQSQPHNGTMVSIELPLAENA
ncbi:MAG: PEP-CTERM system histidine kinase PrsK [Gammaproteobacteria bacterium]|nr:PEP-CTERM system histidine kinase PrsK [Gammaproteobacteria bacterium]